MILSDMIALVLIYIDDVEDNVDIVRLLNVGKNKMAIEVKAKFPDIVMNGALDDTFVFDEEYHELPCLYAAAMLKAKDSSIREKDSYIIQFEVGVKNFVENYDPPPQYRNDQLSQQFKAAFGQTDFEITKTDYDPVYGNLKVFVNGEAAAFNKEGRSFSLSTPASSEGDAVTAVWELHADFSNPPALYPGW